MRKTEVARGKKGGGSQPVVPWYRTPEAVADRKDKSRKALISDGGRELRAVRLDREANEAFQILQAQEPSLDNGAIVRKALIEAAQRVKRRTGV